MRQSIALYIGGKRADCDTKTLVQMTYTREQLDNPTRVKNSYSQGVTLPSTPANDRIFRGYYRNDFRTDVAGFDARVRVPFLLQSDTGEVLERGYLKLNSVASTGAFAHSYSCTLYGGLGGFFYGLTYKEDGSRRTLADMEWYVEDSFGEPRAINLDTAGKVLASGVTGAWDDLWEERDEEDSQVFNFAPAYNGKPECKFDTNKGVYKPGGSVSTILENLYTSSEDGYGPMSGANGYVLVETENEHTELEVQELRAYLQRPVVRMRAFIESLTQAGNAVDGYTFRLAGVFFNDNIRYWNDTWMTLPMFDRDAKNPSQGTYRDLLEGTESPADYLIGFAKMFGLVFDYDEATSTVTLMLRDEYYDTGEPVVDLTRRVDRSKERKVVPFPFAHRYADFQLAAEGRNVDAYRAKYGREYGSQRVDTGYDFDDAAEDLLKDVPFRGAADVQESGRYFFVWPGAQDSQTGSAQNYNLKFARGEQVSWRLYKTQSGETTNKEFGPTAQAISTYAYEDGYADWMARPQFHNAEGEATDGAGVLLMFDGFVDNPEFTAGGIQLAGVELRVTDDNAAMSLLNGGMPCWDFSPTAGSKVWRLPSFRRWATADGEVTDMLDFGRSREYQTPEVPGAVALTMYDNFWKVYLEDRYRPDARVMTCRVDLRGLGNVQKLLRRFFFYDGALWSLNRISNHSLTTLDTTECEFVRVGQMEHYTSGQMSL